MTIVPITSPDLERRPRCRGSPRCARMTTGIWACRTGTLRSSWASLLGDRQTVRGERLSQHPVPVVLSGRAGYAVLRGRLRAADGTA